MEDAKTQVEQTTDATVASPTPVQVAAQESVPVTCKSDEEVGSPGDAGTQGDDPKNPKSGVTMMLEKMKLREGDHGDKALSKKLTYIVRHGVVAWPDLPRDGDMCVKIGDILALEGVFDENETAENLCAFIIRSNLEKPRYFLKDDHLPFTERKVGPAEKEKKVSDPERRRRHDQNNLEPPMTDKEFCKKWNLNDRAESLLVSMPNDEKARAMTSFAPPADVRAKGTDDVSKLFVGFCRKFRKAQPKAHAGLGYAGAMGVVPGAFPGYAGFGQNGQHPYAGYYPYAQYEANLWHYMNLNMQYASQYYGINNQGRPDAEGGAMQGGVDLVEGQELTDNFEGQELTAVDVNNAAVEAVDAANKDKAHQHLAQQHAAAAAAAAQAAGAVGQQAGQQLDGGKYLHSARQRVGQAYHQIRSDQRMDMQNRQQQAAGAAAAVAAAGVQQQQQPGVANDFNACPDGGFNGYAYLNANNYFGNWFNAPNHYMNAAANGATGHVPNAAHAKTTNGNHNHHSHQQEAVQHSQQNMARKDVASVANVNKKAASGVKGAANNNTAKHAKEAKDKKREVKS